jgi:hypothetical protein
VVSDTSESCFDKINHMVGSSQIEITSPEMSELRRLGSRGVVSVFGDGVWTATLRVWAFNGSSYQAFTVYLEEDNYKSLIDRTYESFLHLNGKN